LEDRKIEVRLPAWVGDFSFRFLDLPRHLYNGYWGLFPQGKAARGVTLTTQLQLVLKVRKDWSCTSVRKSGIIQGCSATLSPTVFLASYTKFACFFFFSYRRRCTEHSCLTLKVTALIYSVPKRYFTFSELPVLRG
jgi:hypothetical protein